MKLDEWLKKYKLSRKYFCKKLNISKGYLSLIINNKALPSKIIQKKIYIYTNMKIQPNDFFDLENWNQELKQIKKCQKLKFIHLLHEKQYRLIIK